MEESRLVEEVKQQLQDKDGEVVQVNEQLQQERDQASGRLKEKERKLEQVKHQLQESETINLREESLNLNSYVYLVRKTGIIHQLLSGEEKS